MVDSAIAIKTLAPGFYVVDRANDSGDDREIVLAGPFNDPDLANDAKRRLRANGISGAMTVFFGQLNLVHGVIHGR